MLLRKVASRHLRAPSHVPVEYHNLFFLLKSPNQERFYIPSDSPLPRPALTSFVLKILLNQKPCAERLERLNG